LLSGATGSIVMRPRRAPPADAARVTRAEINLAHVRHNLREIEACLAGDGGPDSAAGGLDRAPESKARAVRRPQIWGVLKADGYGHGAAAIATTLESAGIQGLCVALLEEGIELRLAGLRCPVLVMGGAYGRFRDGVEALLAHQLTPVVYDRAQIDAIARAARFVGRGKVQVHLKLDTGMGRLGAREEQLDEILRALRAAPELELEGLMTHLACADAEDLAETHEQLAHFERLCARIEAAGFRPTLRHAAGSAAVFRVPRAHLDVVRPGIALFGVHPCAPALVHEHGRTPNLKPAMRVLSEVIALRDVPAGCAIGYGHTWRASRPSIIATLPMGYADGLSRALSNRGAVLIRGTRAPIVGTVSMDLTMVDVTDIPGASVRDEVVVLGPQRGPLGEGSIGAEEIAAHIGTIAYECLTNVSRRVPRFYRHP
jgi:alanine racemase